MKTLKLLAVVAAICASYVCDAFDIEYQWTDWTDDAAKWDDSSNWVYWVDGEKHNDAYPSTEWNKATFWNGGNNIYIEQNEAISILECKVNGWVVFKDGNLNIGHASESDHYHLIIAESDASDGTKHFEVAGGTITIVETGGSSQNSIIVGNSATAKGELKINGGNVVTPKLEIATGSGGGTVEVEAGSLTVNGGLEMKSGAELKLTGGTMEINGIWWSGAGTIYLNGGTLKANSTWANFITSNNAGNVYVGANGATIDTNGQDSTIQLELKEQEGSTGGGLVKKGTGMLTLSVKPSFTGAVKVESGCVKMPKADIAAGDHTIKATYGDYDYFYNTEGAKIEPSGTTQVLTSESAIFTVSNAKTGLYYAPAYASTPDASMTKGAFRQATSDGSLELCALAFADVMGEGNIAYFKIAVSSTGSNE